MAVMPGKSGEPRRGLGAPAALLIAVGLAVPGGVPSRTGDAPVVTLRLADGGQLTGRVVAMDAAEVHILGPAGVPIGVARAGAGVLVVRAVDAPGPSEPALDVVSRVTGDRLYGRIVDADGSGLRLDLSRAGRPLRIAWAEVARVEFRREAAAAGPLSGDWARVEFQHEDGSDPAGPDRLEGVVRSRGRDALELDVPHLGRLSVPIERVRHVEELGPARRLLVDPHSHHLGDRDVADLDPVEAEGDELERVFVLGEVPVGDAALVVDVVQLVGMEAPVPLAASVRAGELRTTLRLNGVALPDLNTALERGGDSWTRIRVPIPDGVLRVGENRLWVGQTGTSEDPGQRDNFGLRNLAIEWSEAR